MASLKPAVISSLLNIENHCVVCQSNTNLTIDHIFPKSMGGANHLGNYQIMCKTHNEAKSNYIDYSYEYIDVYLIKQLTADLFNNSNYSTNYKKHILYNAFRRDIVGNELVAITELNSILDFFALYGLRLKKPTKTFKVLKSRSNLIVRFNPDYVVPKFANLARIEKISA